MSGGAGDGGAIIRTLLAASVSRTADSAGANGIGWLDSYTVDFALCRARDYSSYIRRRRFFPVCSSFCAVALSFLTKKKVISRNTGVMEVGLALEVSSQFLSCSILSVFCDECCNISQPYGTS